MKHVPEPSPAPRSQGPGGGLSRRAFIGAGGTLALGGILVACGGDSSGQGSGGVALDGAQGDVQLVKRFPSDAYVPGKVRLPVSLADTTGVLGSEGSVRLPDTLTARVVDSGSGATVVESLTTAMYGATLAVPYWPVTVTIDKPGFYLLQVDEAPDAEVAFQIMERDAVSMPQPGDRLPPFDTPTSSDPRGVEPVCSRVEGVCPFHTVTLADALASGKPVAYLIGTPAFCRTGTCAPALEALMTAADRMGDSMLFLHADVYTDKTATTVAPAVRAYNLSYEPVLYLTDSNGVVTDRLDVVFDADELLSVLEAS